MPLIAGVNDSPAHAEALAKLLGGQNCHVNLIPVNPVAERGTKRPDKGAVQRFAARLGALGLNCDRPAGAGQRYCRGLRPAEKDGGRESRRRYEVTRNERRERPPGEGRDGAEAAGCWERPL